MQIDELKPTDYDAVFALWNGTAGMGLRSLDDSRDGIAAFLRRNPHTCFAAREGGEIVGTILCGHDGRRGYIYHTAVRESRRGNGIGQELVQAVLNALEREGIRKAALVVYENNAGGNAFWQALGFGRRTDLIYRDRTLQAQ